MIVCSRVKSKLVLSSSKNNLNILAGSGIERVFGVFGVFLAKNPCFLKVDGIGVLDQNDRGFFMKIFYKMHVPFNNF